MTLDVRPCREGVTIVGVGRSTSGELSTARVLRYSVKVHITRLIKSQPRWSLS